MDDVNLEWTFEERFELVHSRGMTGSITDWAEFAKGAFGALQPGGYFECHELSMSFRSDDKTHENCESMIRWEDFWKDVGNKAGRSFTVVEDRRLEKSMQLAGFTDIETRVYKMPVGGWPKDLQLKGVGLYTHAAIDMDLEGLMLRPAKEVLRWSLEEATMFAVQLRKELRSREVHAYIPLNVVFGQKPEWHMFGVADIGSLFIRSHGRRKSEFLRPKDLFGRPGPRPLVSSAYHWGEERGLGSGISESHNKPPY